MLKFAPARPIRTGVDLYRDPLPGELERAGRVGAISCLACLLVGVVAILGKPEAIRSLPAAGCSSVATLALALVYARVDWAQAGRRALMATFLVAVSIVAAGRLNVSVSTTFEPLFFVNVAAAAGFFLSRRQTTAVVVGIAIGAAAPPLHLAGVSGEWTDWLALVCAVSLVGLLLQAQRDQLRAAVRQAERLASTDALTGLLNRRGLERAGAEFLARSARRDEPFAVLYFDLDRFKEINDGLGHEAGDDALCRVAEAVDGALRGEDVLVRHGGDEFCVLVPGAGAEASATVAERVHTAVRAVGEADGRFRGLSATVGRSHHPDDGDSLESLIAAADAQVAAAKASRPAARLRAL